MSCGGRDQARGGTPAVETRLEWWELLRDRFGSWQQAHEAPLRRMRLGWLVVCGVGLTGFVVAAVLFPNVRAAAGVYVGVAWLLLCWFVLARTRTLTFGAFTLLYGVCVVWSIVVGLICLRLTSAVTTVWPVYFRSADVVGPMVGIASVAEESLKLLPVAVLVMAAPGRVRRFAAVDWLLVGLASGAAFLCVEEVQRRLSVLAPASVKASLLDRLRCGGTVEQQLDCNAMTRFGLNPFSTKPTNAGVLDSIFGGSNAHYAGHHVLTALVAAGVGISIVIWRAAARLGTVAKVIHRAGAVGLPLLLLGVAIGDHAVFNAEAKAGANLLTNDPYWLKPSSTVALPIRWWYSAGGHGDGRVVLLVGLLVAALMCDASRAHRQGWRSVVAADEVTWVDRARSRLPRWLSSAEASSVARPPRDAVVAVLSAGLALVYIVTRDLQVALFAHARTAGESRREAMLRGRAVLVMQRETREFGAGAGAGVGPDRRWTYRVVAALAAVVLLVLALVVAPHAASSIGYDSTFPDRWLAGLFEGLARWWNSLTPTQQILLTVLLAFVIAIPSGLGAGFFLAGGLTYLAAHGKGVAALLRDPRAATRDYLANRSLGGMALDAGEFALTFVPAGVGSGAGVLARREADRYLADPVAWRAATRAAMRENGERGAVSLDAFGNVLVNGRMPINSADWAGKTYLGKHWTAALKQKYPKGIKFDTAGFPDFGPYATHTYVFKHGFTGVRNSDFKLADKAMGWARRPDGYVWHHVEDGKTLQLIPKDLHNAVRHTGGHAVVAPPK